GGNNVVVTGTVAGNVDFGSGSAVNLIGDTDVFLAKYSQSGAYQWAKRFGKLATHNDGYGVATDGAGYVILTGSTAGNANFGGGALPGSGGTNNYDIVVAKYNSAGAHQWSRAFGDSYSQWGCSVGTDAGG